MLGPWGGVGEVSVCSKHFRHEQKHLERGQVSYRQVFMLIMLVFMLYMHGSILLCIHGCLCASVHVVVVTHIEAHIPHCF